MVPAGQLNQRVTLQRRATGVDSHGQPSESWDDIACVWASAEPLRGREYFAAGQMQSAVSVRFRIRWRADVLPSDRVLWRGVAHDIQGVIDVNGGKHTLELMASTGVGDAR